MREHHVARSRGTFARRNFARSCAFRALRRCREGNLRTRVGETSVGTCLGYRRSKRRVTPLEELLAERIRRYGPIPFADFMRECLYHPVDRKSTRLNSSHGYISYAA